MVWLLGKVGKRTDESGEQAMERNARVRGHYAALMRLAYLREHVFVVSNRPVEEVVEACWFTVPKVFTNEVLGLGQMSGFGSNTITVVGPAEEMAQWQQAIRLADVPEK
jgi:hypothetical protein